MHKRVLALVCSCLSLAAAASAFADSRPNFLIIISDDQRYDSLNHTEGTFMPFTHDLFTQEGVWLDRAYMSTPLCCPSRASILTGMYARHHGVHRNFDPLKVRIFPRRLRDAGYYTGLVGKYLNSWSGDCKRRALTRPI